MRNDDLQNVAKVLHQTKLMVSSSLPDVALGAILSRHPGESLLTLAIRIIQTETELMAQETPFWQRQNVLRELRRQQAEISKRERQNQMVFPELEKQFEEIPLHVPTASGRKVKKGKLTYTVASEYLAGLHKRLQNSRQYAQAKKMVELLRKYSLETKLITWAEVVKREAEKHPQGW
jgi:hypothetical protein